MSFWGLEHHFVQVLQPAEILYGILKERFIVPRMESVKKNSRIWTRKETKKYCKSILIVRQGILQKVVLKNILIILKNVSARERLVKVLLKLKLHKSFPL